MSSSEKGAAGSAASTAAGFISSPTAAAGDASSEAGADVPGAALEHIETRARVEGGVEGRVGRAKRKVKSSQEKFVVYR